VVSLSNDGVRLIEDGIDLRTLPLLLGSRRIPAPKRFFSATQLRAGNGSSCLLPSLPDVTLGGDRAAPLRSP
jgi:hypothetical protein